MNLSIDAARDALAQPTDEVRQVLAGASDEAKAAISSILPEDSSLKAQLTPSQTTSATNGHVSNANSRLQVVDEVGAQ